jgi:hypothetical protein
MILIGPVRHGGVPQRGKSSLFVGGASAIPACLSSDLGPVERWGKDNIAKHVGDMGLDPTLTCSN